MKMAELKQPVKDQISNIQETVSERAKVMARTTDEWAHENPWRVVAMVAVSCLVLGVLLARPRVYVTKD